MRAAASAMQRMPFPMQCHSPNPHSPKRGRRTMRMTGGTGLGIAALAGAAVLLALLNLHLWSSPVDISPVTPPSGKAEAPRPDGTTPATALDKKTSG